MDLKQELLDRVGRVDPRLLAWLTRQAKKLPFVRQRLEAEYERMLAGLASSIKPYRDEFERHARLPSEGLSRETILAEVRDLNQREEARWKDGYVSGAVYHGDPTHVEFLNQVYAITSQQNPLHSDLWPSASRYEAEIVSMTAGMLGAGAPGAEQICGTVTSGGTESILLAMKTYRDRARLEQGVRRPNMVLPSSAHAAFDKASGYFGIEQRRIPVTADFRADVGAARRAIDRNTIVLVGSAPCFPHGAVDPIMELSGLALERGVGFHTDACLGGFLLPWAEKLGAAVPAFDFRLPGVTSISADTHKFGYAAKGTSVVLYRTPELRRHQYYTATEWPGGLYFSPTFAGSRPGALSAACWAAMLSMGEQGYLDAAREILAAAEVIRSGIEQIPQLRVLGDPLFVIAFDAPGRDIYRLLDLMGQRKWNLNGLHKPAAIHLCVTLRHAQPGVAERFVEDLKAAVAELQEEPEGEGGMAPIYGLAATLPFRAEVGELLTRYIDLLYQV
jgi:glutamate/tyrosine decarboxylase-like PLP-dependent enzyme